MSSSLLGLQEWPPPSSPSDTSATKLPEATLGAGKLGGQVQVQV